MKPLVRPSILAIQSLFSGLGRGNPSGEFAGSGTPLDAHDECQRDSRAGRTAYDIEVAFNDIQHACVICFAPSNTAFFFSDFRRRDDWAWDGGSPRSCSNAVVGLLNHDNLVPMPRGTGHGQGKLKGPLVCPLLGALGKAGWQPPT